ncbi:MULTISPECIES: hypothetical protein [Nonomuraea]|uniref:Uncharacterized protein n=1 Tax=Nonomuraea ferruginea TaxID=46174 RepID=A0ABT4SXH2_9ACTN|nr:hypothetical protein [Nonomuraea ferruginea]MDA0641585.1 hypothetical protein [Nonomuraea ferruginea]
MVATNSPRLPAGSLLLDPGPDRHPLPGLPWSIVTSARDRAISPR